jgi:hypothetical protein
MRLPEVKVVERKASYKVTVGSPDGPHCTFSVQFCILGYLVDIPLCICLGIRVWDLKHVQSDSWVIQMLDVGGLISRGNVRQVVIRIYLQLHRKYFVMADEEEEVEAQEEEHEDASHSSGADEEVVGEEAVEEFPDEEPEEPEDTEELYKKRMLAMFLEKREKEEALMASLKPIKAKAAKKKKGKGKVTVTALRPVPGDLFLMEHHLIEVKVKKKK